MTARRLLVALMFALVGSAMFTFWLSRRFSRPQTSAVAKQQYVAAVKDVEPGEMLGKMGLKLVDWPSSMPINGTFTKIDDLAGRTVLYPLAAGEPILDRQLAAAGSGAGLSTKIPDGMRAISLKTDPVVGVAGFLLPGTHVDVLVTYRLQNSLSQVTSMVMQDAQVIAAGQKIQPDPEGKPTTVDVVTLLADPQDAERVVLASSQGTVHFVLRNGTDHEHVANPDVQLSQLGGAAPERPAVRTIVHKASMPTQMAQIYTVKTVSGDKQSSESFQ